jgi:hypothetical protein
MTRRYSREKILKWNRELIALLYGNKTVAKQAQKVL